MTRLTDECLEAARLNHSMLSNLIGESPGVLDALRANPGSAWKAHTDRGDLLAELHRLRFVANENDEVWADLTRVQREVARHRAKNLELRRLANTARDGGWDRDDVSMLFDAVDETTCL